MMQMPNTTPTPIVPSCCWLDDDGPCPSPCVFDDPQETVNNCSYAVMLQGANKPKTSCKHYRAALAPERQGPSNEELMATYWEGAGLAGAGTGAHILRGLRAVLARYGGQQ